MRPFAVTIFLRQREGGGEISPRAVALTLGFIDKPSTGVSGYIGWINFDHCLEVAHCVGDVAFGAPGVAAAVEGVSGFGIETDGCTEVGDGALDLPFIAPHKASVMVKVG